MTLRAVLALTLLAVPAAAQPKQSSPAPEATDALAGFEKELDALFASAGGLTAEQAAARAVKASPSVRARAAQIDVSIAQAEQAELARVPYVGITARATKLSPIDPVNLGGFTIDSIDHSYVGQATVQLVLSDYLVRYPKLISAARLGVQAARVSKRSEELDTAEAARVAYYEWVRGKLQNLVAKRQLTQIRATLGQVRALAEAQRVSRADLMRVESQEAQIEQAADQLQQLADLREEQLRILIGAGNEPLAVGEDVRVDYNAPAAGQLDQLVSTATKQRLDFQAYDLGIEAKDKQRVAERAGLYPKLSAFATADYANPNQRVFPQQDKFDLTWAAGLQLSWTLNEALITNAQDKRSGAELRELRANRENLERGTRIQVLAAQQAVAIAQRALATSKKGLDAAEESYRVRQALLAAQRATAVELVDAETELTRARITALNARIDLRIAVAELQHAIGADAK
ncbi:MAG TPA: TolC family protein [Kofleriaceae bacterium]|nr:TolC family protein [Kofleriaceae bacterium]